jgi:flagellar assembly factor FliW
VTTLDTRFGLLPAKEAGRLVFERGLPGFAGHREFALLPIPQSESLYCLQDLYDETVSFIVRKASDVDGLREADIGPAERALLQVTGDSELMVLLMAVRDEDHGLAFESTQPLAVNLRTQHGVQCGLLETLDVSSREADASPGHATQPTPTREPALQPQVPVRHRAAAGGRRLQK